MKLLNRFERSLGRYAVRHLTLFISRVRPEAMMAPDEAFNRCTICGVTEKRDPRMEFRYCAECAGTRCYCVHHIQGHAHIR